MVEKENLTYLFIGQDIITPEGISKKDSLLKEIRSQRLLKSVEDFNLDILYGRELNLKALQEVLLSLPVKSGKRMLVIKNAQNLKEEIKEYILKYVKKPNPAIILVLDIDQPQDKDNFIRNIYQYARLWRFKEPPDIDTFTLSRSIDTKRIEPSLRVLNQLLEAGQKPEWILGGLRYSWERNLIRPVETRRKLKLLLHCDIEIKTGRLKPVFALEKLVVSLCSLIQPLR